MNQTYTVKQVAEILGYSTNSIYTFLKEKRLKGIRVGKGRFRIPQEELDRLLHLTKTKRIQPAPVVSSEPAPSVYQESIATLEKHLEEVQVGAPCLFDWFVGLGSIILGLTVILFIRHFDEYAINSLSEFILPIKINFIAAGLGLLIADIVEKTRKTWYWIFYLILGLCYLAFSFILLKSGDSEAAVIFGLLPITMVFHFITKWKGVKSFILYTTLLVISFPLVSLFFPSVINLAKLPIVSNFQPLIVGFSWIAIAIFLVGFFFFGPRKQVGWHWVVVIILSLGLFSLSLIYANQLYWSRAFFLILLILSGFIAQFWPLFRFNEKQDRKAVCVIFGTVFLIFFASIIIIWLFQINLKDFNSEELAKKVGNGRMLVESTIDSSFESLESLSANPFLIKAMEKGDNLSMSGLMRNLFDGTAIFKRIILAGKDGETVLVYPEAKIANNISLEEYFVQAKESKTSHLSSLLTIEINNKEQNNITVSTPILDKDNKVKGVIIGLFDLELLRNRLQQLSDIDKGEYFVVVDSDGRRIINQDSSADFVAVDPQSIVLKGLHGQKGLGENYNYKGIKVLQAYDNIPKAGWAIGAVQPLVNTFDLSNSGTFFIVLTVFLSSLVMIVVNLLINKNR